MIENYNPMLTPYDSELALMVESLTGKPCVLKNGGDYYFFEADYIDHLDDKEYLLAIYDAIEGRAGDRLLEITDESERHSFLVRVMYSEQKYPELRRLDKEKPNMQFGRMYCRRIGYIMAVQVERSDADAVLNFVGNGEWEIERRPGGKATFHFLNAAGSVYAHAPEHSYIVYLGKERFEIIDKDTFENEYELK